MTGDGATLSQGVIRPGGKLSFSAKGFRPGSSVRVELHSDPVLLATLTAGPDGSVATDVTVPNSAPGGEHHVVASGTGHDGAPIERSVQLLLDLAPPVVASSSVSTSTVSPRGTIVFSAHMTDDTGVSYGAFTIRNAANGNSMNWPCGYEAARTAGSAQDGTWTLNCKVPDVVNNGNYDLIPYGHDQVGNWVGMDQDSLRSTFTIAGGISDSAPPMVAVVSASPTSVSPGGTVTFSARMTDDTGVTYGAFTIRNSANGNTINWPCGYEAARTAGSAQDGTWTLTCQVPGTVNSGTYEATPYGHDEVGNWAGMNQDSVRTTFTIAGGISDSAPPVVVSVTASPTTVPAAGTIVFNAHITDDTGVTYGAFTIRNASNGNTINWPCGYVATLTGGTAQDGTWALTCQVPDVVNAGSYEVIPYGHDQVGNWVGMNQDAVKTTFTIG